MNNRDNKDYELYIFVPFFFSFIVISAITASPFYFKTQPITPTPPASWLKLLNLASITNSSRSPQSLKSYLSEDESSDLISCNMAYLANKMRQSGPKCF